MFSGISGSKVSVRGGWVWFVVQLQGRGGAVGSGGMPEEADQHNC